MRVLDPVGFAPTVAAQPLAPRLETLDGRSVVLLDCRFENSGVLLEQIGAWFAEHMPGVRTPVVGWRGEVYAHEDTEALEEVARHGGAAILGVGL
jgi:hypothetical protein